MSTETRHSTMDRKFKAEKELRKLMLCVGESRTELSEPRLICYTENKDEFIAHGARTITFASIFPADDELAFIIYRAENGTTVGFAVYDEDAMIYREINVIDIVEYIMPLEDPDKEDRRQQKDNMDTIVRNLTQLIDVNLTY